MKRIYIYLVIINCFGLINTGFAQRPFTAGNIVVYRVGDGSAVLGGTGEKVYLDEYTANGVLVQSILMPTTTSGSNSLLTAIGTDFTTGYLNLSADGKYLVVPGGNVPLGNSTSPTANVIGLVDFNGQVNTSTVITDAPENGRKASTAISNNGTGIWFGGHRVLRYTTAGSSTSVLLAAPRSLLDLDITNNQLYGAYLNSSFAGKIGKAGTGLPTTSGQTMVDLPGLPGDISDAGQFAFADLDPGVAGVDVLYMIDGSYSIATNKGIRKFSLVSGAWVDNGAVGADVINSFYRGLTIRVSGNTVTLFATKANSAGNAGQELVKFVDNSGYNATISGTPTVLASVTTANTMAFRGVARVPIGCLSPASLRVPDISSTQANIVWNAPLGGSGVYEYAVSATSIPPASGTITTNTFAIVNGLNDGVTYYAHVRTNCTSLSTSEWSTVSFVTGCKPPPVSLINIVVTDTGIVNIKWNPVFGASGYEYVLSTSSTQPSTGTSINDTSLSVNNLKSVTQYYIHLRSQCAAGVYSAWTTKSFKTACFMPKITLNVLPKQAAITWSKVNNATRYEYALTSGPGKPLSGTYTNDTTYDMSKIGEINAYSFHVRSICNDGAVSEWSSIQFNMEGLLVYPNPVKDMLQIKINGSNLTGEVVIGDAMGRIIKRLQLTGSMTSVDTRGWAPGIYFVRYSDKNNKYTVRIMKQ
ncbi:MAG TPA: T9SS type A sorting domain-containing protein [Niastella sp.]